MSGWERDGSYGLTRTKASHWHSSRPKPCPCFHLEDIIERHLEPAGFVAELGKGGNWIRVRGPGLDVGDTNAMFVAIAGRQGRPDGAPWEREAWAQIVRPDATNADTVKP